MIIRCPDCGVICHDSAVMQPHERGCLRRGKGFRIQVMNREQAIAFAFERTHAAISIHTPGMDAPELSCARVLRLCFHDLDNPNYNVPLMTKEQAQQIWAFVDNLRDIDLLVVHCDAGFSRSPAVAAAIARDMGRDDREWFKRYLPNRHVYNTLLKERYGEPAAS